MDLTKIIRAMTLAGAPLPAFKALLDEVMELFSEQDQATLKEAYEDAKLENDEGHQRLQEKLAAASRQG
jgi:hypothetical protein